MRPQTHDRTEGRIGVVGAPRPEVRKRTHILLVEDNPGDVRLIREAMAATRDSTHLHVVGDGEQAMEFLRREAGFREAVPPDLVLLDLNLPRKDGREVLAEMQGDPVLRIIPVIVLTSSAAPQDVRSAYALNANCFVTKPADLTEFIRVIQSLEDFWLSTVELPPRVSP